LSELPELALDLAETVTKQARLGEVGRSRQQHRPSEQPLPFHVDAAAAAAELHNALVGWVRLVCEQRAVTYSQTVGEPVAWLPLRWVPGEFVGPLRPNNAPALQPQPPTTGELARWLKRHIYALAVTEGAKECYPELHAIAKHAGRLVCPPAVDIVVDDAKIARARKLSLSASGIATLARELGEEYRNLTRRRVHVLKEAGEISPVPGPWRPDWPMLFPVGEVLDAHLLIPIRARHARAS
ncbi:hypothetical protein ACFRAM_28575, partial [Paenibacillus sp. NPDC056722]|uniref:hypothetical protein n=1 Tax=Paenibacillus sp. NPDC056722 TaxID=3345924 RepID=UPI0036B8A970